MEEKYRTISLCSKCARDFQSYYEFRPDGVYLSLECDEHGRTTEKVEDDPYFFERAYQQDYEVRPPHLVLPITYRCNLNCRYCYTLSNSALKLPVDRPVASIVEYSRRFRASTNLIGGEPTIREDLADIISGVKSEIAGQPLSISTNGQKLKDPALIEKLKESGLDYIFLSLNDESYEISPEVFRNKLAALDNCLKAGMPVWLQRSVDRLEQIDSIPEIVRKYRKIIFQITIRSVKPYGMNYPGKEIFVSDMVRYLRQDGKVTKGTSPFNCHIRLLGKKTKLCSWVNDMGRLDPLDFKYVIANDEISTFHRGMRKDEVMIMNGTWES